MKNKFNLELAKAGHEIECRGYVAARIVDFKYKYYSGRTYLAVKLTDGDENENIVPFSIEGLSIQGRPSLTMKAPIKTLWQLLFDRIR
jgi:hypothetical protein